MDRPHARPGFGDHCPAFRREAVRQTGGIPGGGPRQPRPSLFSMMVTVPELTLVVMKALGPGKHVDHVGAVLAGSHDPLNFSRRRVIAADCFGGLSREPQLAILEHQPMRTGQRAKIDGCEAASDG